MSDLISANAATDIAMTQAAQPDLARYSRAANTISNDDVEAAAAVAQEFEAVFIAEMLKPMFEGIETDGPFGGGKGEEVFRGLMLQEYGKIMAESGGVGLANTVKAQIIEMQAQQINPR